MNNYKGGPWSNDFSKCPKNEQVWIAEYSHENGAVCRFTKHIHSDSANLSGLYWAKVDKSNPYKVPEFNPLCIEGLYWKFKEDERTVKSYGVASDGTFKAQVVCPKPADIVCTWQNEPSKWEPIQESEIPKPKPKKSWKDAEVTWADYFIRVPHPVFGTVVFGRVGLHDENVESLYNAQPDYARKLGLKVACAVSVLADAIKEANKDADWENSYHLLTLRPSGEAIFVRYLETHLTNSPVWQRIATAEAAQKVIDQVEPETIRLALLHE